MPFSKQPVQKLSLCCIDTKTGLIDKRDRQITDPCFTSQYTKYREEGMFCKRCIITSRYMSRNQLNQKLKLKVEAQGYVIYFNMLPHARAHWARSVAAHMHWIFPFKRGVVEIRIRDLLSRWLLIPCQQINSTKSLSWWLRLQDILYTLTLYNIQLSKLELPYLILSLSFEFCILRFKKLSHVWVLRCKLKGTEGVNLKRG